MEDSLKGMIIGFGLISIFVIGITNFVFMFPQEQGFIFSQIDNETYLILDNVTNTNSITNFSNVEDTLDRGFSDWNIEVGYMGSNTMSANKEASNNYYSNVITTVSVLANEVFTTSNGSKHPIVIVLGILTTLGGILGTYRFIKWVRTGN